MTTNLKSQDYLGSKRPPEVSTSILLLEVAPVRFGQIKFRVSPRIEISQPFQLSIPVFKHHHGELQTKIVMPLPCPLTKILTKCPLANLLDEQIQFFLALLVHPCTNTQTPRWTLLKVLQVGSPKLATEARCSLKSIKQREIIPLDLINMLYKQGMWLTFPATTPYWLILRLLFRCFMVFGLRIHCFGLLSKKWPST